MTKNTYYDSHCHLFTRKETLNLRLLFEIILGLLIEQEKYQEKRKTSVSKEDIFGQILEKSIKIKRLIKFLKTGCSDSEEDIFNIMEEAYNGNYKIAPLMFDLECVFVSKRIDGSSDFQEYKNTIVQEYKRVIKEFQDNNLSFIKEAIAVISEIELADKLKHEHRDLEELQELNDELNSQLSLFNEDRIGDKNLLLSNFNLQKKNILKLKKKYPEDIFPFIAVDPRRKNISEKFKKEIDVKKKFCGVKLYTPNGYSPTDPYLMDKGGVYDYCQKNKIPITAHHSNTGFGTPLNSVEIKGLIYDDGLIEVDGFVNFNTTFPNDWVKERATKFNHPDIWEQVLINYPTLKLNLAHFGRGNAKWQEKIYSMLGNPAYPNFYTDLSCWCDKKYIDDDNMGLQYFYDNYFTKASDYLKSKILYGSDFYLDLLYINSLDKYLRNFKKVFSEADFRLISYTNARKFLFDK